MKNLQIQRDVVFFDLETTGIDPRSDRIVEISVLRVAADGDRVTRTRKINPGRPIPPAATRVHGIRDEDVRDEPSFKQIARGLLEFLGDADLAGFNIGRFDVPLLEREFKDCGLVLEMEGRRIIDVMTIFHRMEPRDLSAAVRYYLGRDHEGAHGAEADVAATAEVLDAQLERYADLPRTVGELDRWCSGVPRDAVDRSGKFVWRAGDIVFSFGKNQGRTLREVIDEDRSYVEWILKKDFPADAVRIVREAMEGRWPSNDSDQSST